MQKLNPSVMKCLEPSCDLLPSIQLDSQGTDQMGRYLYTAAQALVCDKHVDYGKEYLHQLFPRLNIRETRSPGWLLKEQGKLRTQTEIQTPSAQTHEQKEPAVKKQPKDENAPASDDELRALQEKFRGIGTRR